MPMLAQDLHAALADAFESAHNMHLVAAEEGRHFHDSAFEPQTCSYPSRCAGRDPYAVITVLCRSAAQSAFHRSSQDAPACLHVQDGRCPRCGDRGYSPARVAR